MIKIGFSNGDLYRTYNNDNERFEKVNDLFCKFPKINVIEINAGNDELLEKILPLNKTRFRNFKYVSLHAPCQTYRNDRKTIQRLKIIEKITKKFNIKNIVIHPNVVMDWTVFNNFLHLPFSIENMDDQKSFGKKIEDIELLLQLLPTFKLTIDLQHVYCNDKSMKMAIYLQKKYKKRVAEFHISGYDKKYIHYQLNKTKQDIIIKSVIINKPLIIESTFDKPKEEPIEINYILNRLKI